MTAPVRVMIVDDSSVVRRLLTSALAQHPEVEVVGTAANGVIALSKLTQLQPEALILDVEMPEMDGISMLVALRAQYPRLPVIMFSTLTERGANVTFDALAAGASDYVLKPSTQTGETLDSVVANALVPKLLALTRSRLGLALQAAIAKVSVDAPETKQSTGLRPSMPSTTAKPAPASSTGNPFARPADGLAGKQLVRSPQLALPARPSLAGPLATEPKRGLFPSSPPPASKVGSTPNTGLTALPFGSNRQTGSTSTAGLEARARPSLPAKSGTSASSTAARPGAPMHSPIAASLRKSVQIIVIAASTGGPNALAEVIPRLPGGLPVPIVIVQHMPPIFTRCLADRLSARSALSIVESQGGERLLPGHVYIAPGHRHLEVVRDVDGMRTLLSDGPPENSCRPAADVLMRSVVRAYGAAVLGVVLTGMGHDGLRGSRDIVEAGGRVLVQSGGSCVVWGMPKAVEEAGIAEAVVPLTELAAAMLQRVGTGLLPQRNPEGTR